MSVDCPYAPPAKHGGTLAVLRERAIHSLIPVVRAYTRYGRSVSRRQAFWWHVVKPYFSWHSHKYVARASFGAKMAGDTQDILPQVVYYFGVWEPNLTRWLSGRLRPGDTFVDVGANIGYFSLLASKLVGESGRVVAIEAVPSIFAGLEGNIARNRSRNIRALNVAAAESARSVTAFRGPEFHTGIGTVFEEFGFTYEGEVEAAPLASLLTSDEVADARVIKIDVEGSELGVVKGMVEMLADTREDLELVVELHPVQLAAQGDGPGDVIEVMATQGFHPYALNIEYHPERVLADGALGPLPRLFEPPERELDVVFSREDRDAL